MKKLFLAFALLCVSLFAETVKVGIDKEYPPFSYLNNGVMAGFEVDLLKEIASQTGIKIEFVPMIFDDIFNEVESGHIDVGCGAIELLRKDRKGLIFLYLIIALPIFMLQKRQIKI